MKVLILGSSGYIGNALMYYLESKKFEVFGCDNGSRQILAPESLTKVKPHKQTTLLDVTDYGLLKNYITNINPDVIVHLAENPSAPYSMKNAKNAGDVQNNNVVGSLNVLWAIREVNPKIQLIKLGTAGEYPDWLFDGITIPENSRVKVKYQDKDWEIPTPRYFGSFYHASKFFDSYNCDYACRIWGLNITDINQAPVYGWTDGTRFDYDEEFGTVVNRFVAQALAGYPLTVYGTGGQTRGYIHLQNSLEAIELIIKNPADGFRIVNQLTETKKVIEIAELVQKHTGCDIKCIDNPRAERNENEFVFQKDILDSLGLKPIYMEDSIGEFIEKIKPYKDKIDKSLFNPKIKWS